jgi:hypothetical protein
MGLDSSPSLRSGLKAIFAQNDKALLCICFLYLVLRTVIPRDARNDRFLYRLGVAPGPSGDYASAGAVLQEVEYGLGGRAVGRQRYLLLLADAQQIGEVGLILASVRVAEEDDGLNLVFGGKHTNLTVTAKRAVLQQMDW